MNKTTMNNKEKKIFRAIPSGDFLRRDLLKFLSERQVCSRAVLDRSLIKFKDTWDFIGKTKKQGEYFLTEKGREYQKEIETKPMLNFKDSGLEKIIEKLPTEAHRGLVYFILATIVAKKYLPEFEDFWPGFIIGGKPGDIKTALGKLVCRILGLSLKEHIQIAIPKTAKQVIGTSYQLKGVTPPEWRINPADYWGYSFLTWDEVDKVANKEVWRNLFLYLDGHRVINERKTDIDIDVTTLVCMNFKTSKLEIPTYYLRRCFVVDSKALHLNPRESEEIGDFLMHSTIPRLKIDKLPVAIYSLDQEEKSFLRELLYRDLKSIEEGEVVDTGFLEKIVLGMLILQESGDIKHYSYWAASKALTFLETQGRTKEGWRKRLDDEWSAYYATIDPKFAKEWAKKLAKIREGEEVIKNPPPLIDKPPDDKILLIKFSPLIDRLKQLKTSFEDMNGDKQSVIIWCLNIDLKRFTSKLPTEKRENRVTENVLGDIEAVVEEWEIQHKPIREAWEAEQKKNQAYKEQKEATIRSLIKAKAYLRGSKGKDSKGNLWSRKVKPTIEKIGLCLDPKTQKKYLNKTYIKEIQSDISAFQSEWANQKEERKVKTGRVELPNIFQTTFEGLTKEESTAVVEETIEKVGQPIKTTTTVPAWKYYLIMLERKLRRGKRGKPRPKTIQEQIDYDIEAGGNRPNDPFDPTQRDINKL